MAAPAAAAIDPHSYAAYEAYARNPTENRNWYFLYKGDDPVPYMRPVLTSSQFDRYRLLAIGDEFNGIGFVRYSDFTDPERSDRRLELKDDSDRSIWVAAEWFKLPVITRKMLILPHNDFDVIKWTKEVKSRLFPYRFSNRVITTEVHGRDAVMCSIDVLMEYNGVHMKVGEIVMTLNMNGRRPNVYLDWFRNYFRTVPVLVEWHRRYLPHVDMAGVTTSALYWFVSSCAPDALTIRLQACSLLKTGELGQRRLEEHYESMGFEVTKRNIDGDCMMESSIAQFLATTAELIEGRPRFTFNSKHVMSTRSHMV